MTPSAPTEHPHRRRVDVRTGLRRARYAVLGLTLLALTYLTLFTVAPRAASNVELILVLGGFYFGVLHVTAKFRRQTATYVCRCCGDDLSGDRTERVPLTIYRCQHCGIVWHVVAALTLAQARRRFRRTRREWYPPQIDVPTDIA